MNFVRGLLIDDAASRDIIGVTLPGPVALLELIDLIIYQENFAQPQQYSWIFLFSMVQILGGQHYSYLRMRY